MGYIISYDIGPTGVKTCLFTIDKEVRLVAGQYGTYSLTILENGGAEQDADEWWQALCTTTEGLLAKTGVSADEIDGISFCSQMQGMVLVDKDGNAVRKPMSYMDQRAGDVMKKYGGSAPAVLGLNTIKLIRSLCLTTAAPISVKDPIWKYLWVKDNEPENFKRAYKWLDVKEYLICRASGEFVMTKDSAYATFLYDTRDGKWEWSKALCDSYGVDINHMPKVIECTDMAGRITKKAASELHLKEGTPVFGGGGDATLIGIGAGCVSEGQTHIYSGTSGWVSTVTAKQLVDPICGIAAVVGAGPGIFNYFAEMETAGKCFEWVKDHLALDEIGVYLEKKNIAESVDRVYESLYDYLSATIAKSPAGAGGVIFTPWLHGNRCPFEDADAAGIFFNIKIETGKTELMRAVLEGICFHLRWMLEKEDKKVKTSDVIRFVGGGALSPVTCQILADITGRTIETVTDAQDVGAVGAALIAGVGLKSIESLSLARDFIPVKATYRPNPENAAIYEKNYDVFIKIYEANKKLFHEVNGKCGQKAGGV